MSTSKILRYGVVAGLAGGTAEIIWLTCYNVLTGASGDAVARGVTMTLLPVLADQPVAIPLGIAIHMGLSVGLGIVVVATFSMSMLARMGDWPRSALVVLTLCLVWAFNFLIVLPVLQPRFLTLLPLTVSFASKLMFGVGAAAILRLQPSPSRSET